MVGSYLSGDGPMRSGPSPEALPGSGHHIASIEVLRGLVMVMMALDHTRLFFSNALFDPVDPAQTNLAYFATRWITHFCAPVFVFLAGTVVFLRFEASSDRRATAKFLLTRGLFLVALEISVVNVGWTFRIPEFVFLQLIWVLGASMIVLAGLVYLPLVATAAFGLIMVAGHNLLDGIAPSDFGAWATLWKILHVPKGFEVSGIPVWPAYPLVPWVGVMALGYAFGSLFRLEAGRRKRAIIVMGSAMTLAFLLLRFGNLYGDPEPWIGAGEGTMSLISFFNTDKYPPSLLFLLMTMGPALLFLAFADRIHGLPAKTLSLFGRVPVFFYLVHIYLIHLMALFIGVASGYSIKYFFDGYWHLPRAEGYGYDLLWVYILWALVVAALYPICRWYAALTFGSGDRVLSDL